MYATIIMILGAIVSVFYIAGMVKGVRESFAEFRQQGEEDVEDTLSPWYVVYLIGAVIAAACLIGLMGTSSFWIYLPGFTALIGATITAAGFFLEKVL